MYVYNEFDENVIKKFRIRKPYENKNNKNNKKHSSVQKTFYSTIQLVLGKNPVFSLP